MIEVLRQNIGLIFKIDFVAFREIFAQHMESGTLILFSIQWKQLHFPFICGWEFTNICYNEIRTFFCSKNVGDFDCDWKWIEAFFNSLFEIKIEVNSLANPK